MGLDGKWPKSGQRLQWCEGKRSWQWESKQRTNEGQIFEHTTPRCASFFEMTLKQDSIYTPGKVNLTMELTDKAKVKGDYRFIVSIYMSGTLIRKQTLTVAKKEPAVFELMFPDVYSRTDSRCRSEVLIAGAGFEPATSGLWARRATRLLYPAIINIYILQKKFYSRRTKTNYKFFRIFSAISSIFPCSYL